MIDTREREITTKADEALREVPLPDLAATGRLGAALARALRPGDVVALAGALGAGKTTLARAIIAALGGGEEVPSPTFTLAQSYELPGGLLWHFDLYRLAQPRDAWELGIEDAFAEAISLIEWPERLGALLPADRLEIALEFAGPDVSDAGAARRARLAGHGAWASRLRELAL